jgi:FeS assembly SUF system protein
MDGKPGEHEIETLERTAADSVAAPASAPALEPAPDAKPATGSALSEEELEQLTADIVGALKTVYDPEIPADIYELGLIYKIDISDDRQVEIDMTLTAPGCPVAGEMPMWVENAVNAVPGISGTKVNLTFDPPWDQSRMSEEAKFALGMF